MDTREQEAHRHLLLVDKRRLRWPNATNLHIQHSHLRIHTALQHSHPLWSIECRKAAVLYHGAIVWTLIHTQAEMSFVLSLGLDKTVEGDC